MGAVTSEAMICNTALCLQYVTKITLFGLAERTFIKPYSQQSMWPKVQCFNREIGGERREEEQEEEKRRKNVNKSQCKVHVF